MPQKNPARPQPSTQPEAPVTRPAWTFLTNHAQVLLVIAQDQRVTAKAIASQVGVTERAVQRILADLESAGYISRTRDGRQNLYEIHAHMPMRHPAQRGHAVRELFALLSHQ
jgi:uncharacterized membrane protein